MNKITINNSSILENYRNITENIKLKKEEILNSQSPKTLTKIIEESQNLFQKVNEPITFIQDCKLLRKVTKTAVNQTSSVNLGSRPFSLNNLENKIKQNFFEENNFKWENLGEYFLKNSKTLPITIPFVYGLEKFEIIKKIRNNNNQKTRKNIETLQELEKKKQLNSNNERVKTLLSRAEQLCKKLENQGKVPLSKIIIENDSFIKCIENAFELSHLVREGRVAIQNNNKSIYATANVSDIKQSDRRKQCILHLRESDFEKYLSIK